MRSGLTGSIGPRMRASLVVRALENVVMQRDRPVETVAHSGRDGQFRSQSFQRPLRRQQLQDSVARVASAGDNSAMESFFSLLQKRVLDRKVWEAREELRLTIVSWAEGKRHRKRRQHRLGRLTSVEFEVVNLGSIALSA